MDGIETLINYHKEQVGEAIASNEPDQARLHNYLYDIAKSSERNAVAQWFADTWLMVAMNEGNTYQELMEKEGDSISSISDELREEWETLAEQVSELVEENISPIAGLFIREMLQGWGSYPFDLIARQVIGKKVEVSA
jgi:uncharacterized protein YerC